MGVNVVLPYLAALGFDLPSVRQVRLSGVKPHVLHKLVAHLRPQP